MLTIPSIFAPYAELRAAQTTRHGGVSTGFYSSLNLGLSTDDLSENVEKNRKIVLESLGLTVEKLLTLGQVHGNVVLYGEKAGHYIGYDAVITQEKGLTLAVTIADCTPILLYDPKNQAIAAIHAGWKGTASKIVVNTLRLMQEKFGTNPETCLAYIGTCISRKAFEVGEEVALHFSEDCKYYDSQKAKYFVDLKRSNELQLLETGILPENIEISPDCSFQQAETYFSHRAEKGITGRMWALIGMK